MENEPAGSGSTPEADVVHAEVGPPPRRSGRIVALIAAGGIAAVAAVLGYQVISAPEAPEGPIRLAVGFREGEAYRYAMTMAMDGEMRIGEQSQEMDTEMTATATYRVTDVAENGTMTMSVALEDLRATLGGEEVPFPGEFPTTEMEVTPEGRIFAPGTAPGAAGPTQGAPQQWVPPLPDRPIEPGDEWDTDWEQPFPLGEGTIHLVARSAFLRYEEVAGVLAAVIETKGTSTGDVTADLSQMQAALPDQSASGELGELDMAVRMTVDNDITMTYWLDPETGEMVKVEGVSDGSIVQHWEGDIPDDPMLAGLSETGFTGTTRFAMERT